MLPGSPFWPIGPIAPGAPLSPTLPENSGVLFYRSKNKLHEKPLIPLNPGNP